MVSLRSLVPVAMVAAGLAVPGSAVAAPEAPPAPTGVTVPTLAYDDTSVSLVWQRPPDGSAVAEYRVYADGRYVGGTAEDSGSAASAAIRSFYADPGNAAQVKAVRHDFTAHGLTPDTRYRFTVRAVDAAGRVSAPSRTLVAWTTPTPTVLDVRDFGAVGDGSTVDTAAIQDAIDACPPGGEVLIPGGVFVSGAIWLHSRMTLELARGATLRGSADADDYPYGFRVYRYSTDPRFQSLINAQTWDDGSLTDIRIAGEGTIDGNGWKQSGTDADGTPVWAKGSASTVDSLGMLAAAEVDRAGALGSASPYGTRSNLVTLRGVDRAYIGGVTAVNPAQHTFSVLESNDVTVAGTRMQTFDANNGDGIDFGNGDGLTAYDNYFDTGDDQMNFAAGLGAQGEHDPATRHAWIFDNYFKRGHGAVVAGSHTAAWIEDVVAEDNVIDGSDVALRMKTNPVNGGGARRFLFRDNAVRDIQAQAFIFTAAYSDPNAAITFEPAADAAHFTDVTVRDVTVDGTAKESISVIGVPGGQDSGFRFEHVHFLDARPAALDYLTGSVFSDVVFDTQADPWRITHSSGLRFSDSTTTTAVTVDAETAPWWPSASRLTASAGDTSVRLDWPAAADDTGVSGYLVYAGTALVATASTPGVLVDGLAPARPYRLAVVAVDATGNASPVLSTRVRTTGDPDTTAPTVPAGTEAVAVDAASSGSTWATVAWQPAADDHGVAGYVISVDGRRVGSTDGATRRYTVTGLRPGADYRFTVTAVDASGNATPYPAAAAFTTPPAPVLGPLPPGS